MEVITAGKQRTFLCVRLSLKLLSNNQTQTLRLFLPVVLPGRVCGVRYLPSELGRRLGAVVHVGGVQQDLRGRSVLLHEAL